MTMRGARDDPHNPIPRRAGPDGHPASLAEVAVNNTLAPKLSPGAQPSALDIFRARAEARAILYAAGEFDLLDAVDGLQQAAEASGLIDNIGQDAVQQITAECFGGVR